MLNKVILIGNVGTDPEVRTLENGTKVARVRLATTERVFNRQTQEAKEYTEWHTVILWRGLADVADRFVRKGSQIYVEGSIRSNEWTDQNGAKRVSVEINANDMKLLGRRSDNQQAGSGYGSQQAAPAQGAGYNATAQNSAPSQGYAPQSYGTPQQSTPQAVPPPADDVDDLPF